MIMGQYNGEISLLGLEPMHVAAKLKILPEHNAHIKKNLN
jgi:hypothetical protein